MTKKEAFDIVDGVLARVSLNREDHVKLMQAMQLLVGDESAKVTPIPEIQPDVHQVQ